MTDLLNKTITISAKEEKLAGGKPVMKIKDEKNLVYSVWKFKQDGTESVAWGQIPNIGETTQIGYVEEVKQTEQYGAVTYRTIRNFNPDLANTTPKAEKQHSEVNIAPQTTSKDDKYWDMKAYKQCLWNWWLEKSNGTRLGQSEMDTVWFVFKQIEQDANKRFFIYSEKENWQDKAHPEEPLPEELTIIDVNQDISVEDIPFN